MVAELHLSSRDQREPPPVGPVETTLACCEIESSNGLVH